MLLTFRDQKLHLLTTRDIHAFFGETNSIQEIEDLSSLHYLVLGPKGISLITSIQYQNVSSWQQIQTEDGFSFGVGKDQLLAILNKHNIVDFIPAEQVEPGMSLVGIEGTIDPVRETGDFDVLSRFLSNLPPDLLETLDVTGVREYLASIEDVEKNETVIAQKHPDFMNEIPNHLSLQVFKQLVATYGLYDNEINNIKITSKESHTALNAMIRLNNHLYSLLGLFLKHGFYDSDGHPYLIVPLTWKSWAINLVSHALSTSIMTFPGEKPDTIEIHFGGELEGYLLKYAFNIPKDPKKRLIPTFLYASPLSRIALVLKFFNKDLLDLRTDENQQLIFEFPSPLFTQSVYYLLKNYGYTMKQLNSKTNTVLIQKALQDVPTRKVVSNQKITKKTTLYSIHTKHNKPFFANYGYTFLPSTK